MMLRSPILRAMTLMNYKLMARSSVSIEKGLHDPSKHITMNHFPHTYYIDYWPIGQYPELYVSGSIAPTTYQAQAEKIFIDFLNAQYNTKLEIQDIMDYSFNKLFTHVLKADLKNSLFLISIFQKLARGIIVKESRWTWIREQQIRSVLNPKFDFNTSTVREFFEMYNQTIENLTIISNFGFARNIEHELTAQEQHLQDQQNTVPTGIEELSDTSRTENSTFLNKVMNFIHSH